MKKIYTTIIHLIIISLVSCNGVEKKNILSGKININTEIENIIVDIFDGEKFQLFDTIFITKDKSFQTQYSYTEQILIRLRIKNLTPIDIILNGKDIYIYIAEQENQIVYKIKGSTDTEYLLKGDSLYKQYKKYIQTVYGETTDTTNNIKIKEDIFSIQSSYNRQIKKLIWQTNNSISGILLTYLLQNSEQEILFLDSISDKFSKEISNNSYKDAFQKKREKIKSLPIGSEAPNIYLPSPNGENISLVSLRGKYVLVEFWASWCKPCRQQTPILQKIYQKYNTKGLEILSVSIDKNKESWIKAIQEDNIVWKNVLDTKNPIQQAVQIYDITFIPYWIFLDKNGRIIEKKTEEKKIEIIMEVFFNKL